MPPEAPADPHLQPLDADLDFLRRWREPVAPRRLLRDFVGSIAVHALFFSLLVIFPEGDRPIQTRPIVPDVRNAVHLVAPKFYEPTQKAPNKSKPTRELDVRSAQSAPASQAPRFRPPQPTPGPAAAAPQPVPLIEQPKIQVASSPPPPQVMTVQPLQPVPVTPPSQPAKPKLSFESVAAQPEHVEAPNPIKVPIPKPSIQPGAGGTIVGDIGDSSATFPNLSQTPAAGRIGSNLQLLSDPKGIDFKPYLIQILTAVRRNWLSIIPESARLGRRGRVLVQFAIDRTGGVPKLVIAEGAGTDAFDRAAVAAISASYPFPPLPAEYKGDQIRVQFAFSYNLTTR
jgi:TonB family protein